MKEFTDELKTFARDRGADLVGIASIDRFEDLSQERHPAAIFPETKSVVVIGRRITRGTLRGVEEGTQFNNYNLFGYSWLNDRFIALTTYETVEFLENNGWESVPLPPLPVQTPPMGVSVRENQPPPNVMLDFDDAAVRAGLGEIGYCGIFLSSEFGPRQRFQLILTDAELEPDPIPADPICDRDMACVQSCPLSAINPEKETELNTCGKKMVIAEVDFSKCRGCKNGARPNMYHPSGNPDRLAAICVRSCIDYLERREKLTHKAFHNPFRKRPVWTQR
jgi:epoxyqueuosine reductase